MSFLLLSVDRDCQRNANIFAFRGLTSVRDVATFPLMKSKAFVADYDNISKILDKYFDGLINQ